MCILEFEENISMIQPEFKSLIEILSGKLFRIPEYQRHYSWQSKQRKDLFEDIEMLQEKRKRYDDRIHFMATVVCLKTKDKQEVGSNTYYVYDVVDGQQRLTTLIILLRAISKRLKADGQEDEAKEVNKLLVKDDGRLIILQNNHDNRFLLRNYLETGSYPNEDSIKTAADDNLTDAIRDCEKFVNSSSDAVNLLALVKNSLFFIFQSLEDKGAVYTIFEVLNSRGLDVDWLDKCKSLLMGLLYEYSMPEDENLFDQHLNELQEYWSQIYREIGLYPIRGSEIIQFAATLKSKTDAGRPLSAEESLEFFKEECSEPATSEEKINRIITFTIWIRDVTKCLAKLYGDIKRNAVTEILQARLLAVSIMLRSDLNEGNKDKLLEQWERTSFKIFGIFRKDARQKRGEYVRTSKRIIRKEHDLDINSIIVDIAQIGNDFLVDDFETQLVDADSYNEWQKELRYFLYRYEEYLCKQNGVEINQVVWNEIWNSNVHNTIEHILPQDSSELCWATFSGKDDLLHVLGNLTLLPPRLNSQAGKKCFVEKKDVYKRANIYSFDEIIFNNGSERRTWNASAVKARTNQLIEFAKIQWKDLDI